MAVQKTAAKKAPTTTAKPAAKKGAGKPAAKKTASKPAAPAAKKTAAKKAAAKKPVATKAEAAKRAVEREVYKVSPLRGMAIGDYIKAKLSGWQAEVTARLVELTLAAAPGATVAIKWSQPVFEINGPFAFIKPAKAHLSVGFWRGAELADPKKLLEVASERMGHFKLRGPGTLDEKAFTAMVKEAVRLNREKGNPTMRGK